MLANVALARSVNYDRKTFKVQTTGYQYGLELSCQAKQVTLIHSW
jgi:hypothetical protein